MTKHTGGSYAALFPPLYGPPTLPGTGLAIGMVGGLMLWAAIAASIYWSFRP